MKEQPHQPEGIPPAVLAANAAQGRRVANSLLAWWNADNCGGFDLTELGALGDAITADMTTVLAFIARVSKYPNSLGYGADFKAIVRAWRPELAD